jgi:uncharacterized protein with PQ loop repeat
MPQFIYLINSSDTRKISSFVFLSAHWSRFHFHSYIKIQKIYTRNYSPCIIFPKLYWKSSQCNFHFFLSQSVLFRWTELCWLTLLLAHCCSFSVYLRSFRKKFSWNVLFSYFQYKELMPYNNVYFNICFRLHRGPWILFKFTVKISYLFLLYPFAC